MNLTRRVTIGADDGLGDQLVLRPLELSDAEDVAAAYLRNRGHLAPWEPARSDEFFTVAGQEAVIRAKLGQYAAGSEVPWVITGSRGIYGMMTLTGIVRGPFLNANLGYWIDVDCTGRGAASGAVAAVVDMATNELGLHRIQAATLLHNAPSQAVLARCGFERIGFAPTYLQIAGEWQDHVLFQRILF
ncbi:ribosomal-protein-alanine N-acetyltransferase [Paenarthrobacter nitroguajacolicus]|uniref:GNAT family N-acetyltransferase n=1 Tax=Paenarthrobacter TaxID=1742992 RepID=UPI002861F37F|nr:GNAT family N-acetyltransferase [Paenarthrobacter nitroguajacolicus]MDR6989905.1 ribosomal-protein-alanine N-acetyltransferase [Paenarthrobacter nitroguajacolicus]